MRVLSFNKTLIVTCVITFSSLISVAQVGIGTDSPAPGTSLHVKDDTGTSGILFPKVDIVDLNTVAPLPAATLDGTIVYNTNTATGEGYYFFKDTRWQPIFGKVGGMAKFTNGRAGSSSENLNNTWRKVDLIDNTYFNDDATVYQRIDDETLQVNAAGRYKIIINLSLTGKSNDTTAKLLALEGKLRINNADTGGVYRTSEIISDNSTVLDFSSLTLTEIVELNVGDKINFNVQRTQDTGGIVYLRSTNSSSFFIERML